MEQAIEIKNLSKSYKDFTLKQISLSVPAGTVMGLIGENGAGKSTLISALLGIVRSQHEQISILGKDLHTHEKEIKEDLAVIFDKNHYDKHLTPAFIGRMLSHVYANWDQTKYEAYLQRFSLPPKKQLKKFSRGMQMKLEFAIAFSHDARLLVLDEATGGLDPVVRDEILELLREFTEQEDHTVLLSSHITSDLDKIADYIAYLHDGQLLFVKTCEDIRENYGVLNCGKDLFDTLSKEDVAAYRKEEYGYKVLLKNRREFQKVFRDVAVERATVEDMMVYYTKGEQIA